MAKVFRWAAGRLQKAPEDRDAAYQNAGKGAGKGLKPGYCITSLSEASGKALESARQMAKVVRGAAGRLQKAPEDREAADQRTAKGPGEHLKPGQAPKECKRSREALKARPGIAQKSSTTLFLGRAPPAVGWGRRISFCTASFFMAFLANLC